jgi:two-component system, NarL family, sensor kinase
MFFFTRRTIGIVALLLSLNGLSAQPKYFSNLFKQKRDSLVEVLKKYPASDTSRAKALYKIIESAAFLKEKKEVLPYWLEAMALSRKLKFKVTESACLAWMGGFYKSERKKDSALMYIDSAIQLADHSSDIRLLRTKGKGYYLKGGIYENQENFYVALYNYFEALKNYDTTMLFIQKDIYSRIASIYQELNNEDKAIEYYKASGEYLALAEIYFKRNEVSKAKYYLEIMKPSMPDTAETQITGGYYHLLGRIADIERKNDSSIIFFKDALKYYNYNREMHTGPISYVLADMARVKMEKSEMKEAKNYALQGIETAKESNHKEAMENALEGLAEYYHKAGNPSAAYLTLQRAKMLKDSILEGTNIKQANSLAAIYENSKKEREISNLQADKELQTATLKQKSLWNTFFLITLGGLLITGALFWRNYRTNQRLNIQKQFIQQKRITDLEREKQLMAVEALLKGQEEERARLAKDLHDGLGGMLSGIKISFSNMKEYMIMDAANFAAFDKLITQLDNTNAELRKISHNMMPDTLVKFGLQSAIKDYCESVQLVSSTKIICEQLGENRELGSTADVNVYRIIQELLNNAVKHGHPDQILVQLTKSSGNVLITVEDNGKGFDPDELKQFMGIGFANVKHRVDYLNGKLEILSKPGEGTTVNIELSA